MDGCVSNEKRASSDVVIGVIHVKSHQRADEHSTIPLTVVDNRKNLGIVDVRSERSPPQNMNDMRKMKKTSTVRPRYKWWKRQKQHVLSTNSDDYVLRTNIDNDDDASEQFDQLHERVVRQMADHPKSSYFEIQPYLDERSSCVHCCNR